MVGMNCFSLKNWEQAFAETGIDPASTPTASRGETEILPFELITAISAAAPVGDRRRALRNRVR